MHQVAKAACYASADIEDARDGRRLDQPTHHRDRIIDINEVTFLLAVGDASAMRLEQADRFAGLGIVEPLGDEAHHLAFVVFIRTEYIEKLQTRPLRRELVATASALDDGKIEQLLAPAVEIHRPQALECACRPIVAIALAAITIGRRRGGINEWGAGSGAPVEQPQR